MSPAQPTQPHRYVSAAVLSGIGARTESSLAYLGGLAALVGKSLASLLTSPLKRGRTFQRAVHQAMIVGVRAIPIITLITFFVGVIIALQGAYGLRRLGAMQLVAGLVAISITRELGPLVAAIVVIGRSGSSFAAEIGAMRVSEELDALKTMALDPVAFLVTPKLLAMVVMMPCLAIWSDLMGVTGGALFGVTGAGFTFGSYFMATREALVLRDVTTGIVKSLVFGIVITAVGCYEGFSTGAGAEEVGRSTTSAVVISILLVVLIDLTFTYLFYSAGHSV
ncbi:MAG TPA: ABC transporter permease [Bryobacteraceae bacterium]|jgi:phospholipid/cholesterol/gamma-HCH transport system permease protein|nr:ABC transporter permease [Bryobacteraceae bacterium]